jgi:hypothetical protein
MISVFGKRRKMAHEKHGVIAHRLVGEDRLDEVELMRTCACIATTHDQVIFFQLLSLAWLSRCDSQLFYAARL